MEELPRVVLGENCQKPNFNAIVMQYWVKYISLELSLCFTCIKQILFVISYCKLCGDKCKEKDSQNIRLLPITPIWYQIFCSVAVYYEKKTFPSKWLIFLKFVRSEDIHVFSKENATFICVARSFDKLIWNFALI